jgi:hypothetical protein
MEGRRYGLVVDRAGEDQKPVAHGGEVLDAGGFPERQSGIS